MATPVVNSVTPLIGDSEFDRNIQIFGSGFDNGLAVHVGETAAINVIRINSNTVRADVPAGVSPGSYDIKVTNPGGETHTLERAYRVIFTLPEPPFADQTREVVLARILSVLEENWDTSVGSFPHAIASAVALEISRSIVRGNDIFTNFFPQYSRAGMLDLWGEALGLPRTLATRATGTLKVFGINGVNIPEGTRFSTTVQFGTQQSAVEFRSTESGIIGQSVSGEVEVAIEAILAGTNGNVGINRIDRLLTQIQNVSGCNNVFATIGGENIETDDEYRVRLLAFVENPISGGNRHDYLTWALEVPGVGAATVVPLNRGNGTVDIFILDENFDPASQLLVDAVQDYIAPATFNEGGGKAPIGADVLVAEPTTVEVDVTVNFNVATGYNATDVKASIEANITQFLRELDIGSDVVYVHVANVIHDTEGVANYSALQVDAGTADISIGVSSKAVAGTITATAV